MFNRLVSTPREINLYGKKNPLLFRVLIISSLVIYLIETTLMVFLEYLLGVSDPLALVLDGLILIFLLFPINYIFIARPLSRQIDEHAKTNQELLEANEILERFFSISDVSIAYMNANFNFLRVNQAYAATDQRPPETFIGKNHFDLFPNEENQAIFTDVVKTGIPYNVVEKPFEYKNHPERGITYWDWSLIPVKSSGGQVIALILVLNNVTDRKQAQLALADSERRFRVMFNQAFQHSVLLDPQGKALLANQTALDFTGLNQEEIAGLPLWQFPWWPLIGQPEVGGKIEAAVQESSKGSVARFEEEIQSRTGARAMMDITIKPVHDSQGSTTTLIYEARDMTERYQAREDLKRSEEENKRLYLAERTARQLAESLRSAVLALSASLNSETVLGTLLDHLNKVVPYSSAHILLLEDDEHVVVTLARGEEHWEEQVRLLGKKFDLNGLLFLHPLIKRKEILSVPDAFVFPGSFFLPQDEYVRSWLGIPLLAGEQIIGICLLEHVCPEFFNDDLIQWATTLTGQASVAIQNAWLYEQVRDGREHLQALSRRLVEVQENERHYIARELHDEAGQALTSLMFGLRLLELESADQASVLLHTKEIKQIADSVLESLHRLAVNLRPSTLDHLGLVAAIRQHADMISVQQKMAIQFETVGVIERLPDEMETAIYRIVQESLTNVVRHSQATRVDILLERRDNHIVVVVEDNGVGFDPHSPKKNQLGIIGMVERAEMLGGKIMIESSPGKGSTVMLEVPCQYGF